MASRVGNYLLFETLGEGAFGKVKLGVHEETGEQVAVKIMDKSDIKAQEMTMNVRREIAIMKALKHRNIVNLRQVLTSQSKLYIVMDLVTGGELFTKILKEGKLEENTARHYFQQLVDGIEYCHRRGVCHRDLKPENLLIDETTGELKITDFGLSAMKGASTTEELLHTQCGSPNYCAPEIIARHKQGYNGAKVDAWSCGIILFALLAGFLPFYDENTKVLYRMIQRDDVKFPKKFPPEAKDLVLRLLHKEPERRFTLNDVKRHSWFLVDYNGGDTDPRSGGSTASPPLRPRRKGRHGRKPSIDQGPKSREMQTRKKSEKSDRSERSDPDGSSSQPLPPIPPAVIDPPLGHGRPPVPPPVAPPVNPMSPLPPVPPVQPSPVSPAAAKSSRPPAPPVPPPVSPKTRSKASGSVPAYSAPTHGNPRRKNSRDRAHRRSRDTFPSLTDDIPPAVSKEQPRPVEGKTGAPAYPFPAPPPFPPAPPVARAAPPRSIEITTSPSSETAENPDNDSQVMASPALSSKREDNGLQPETQSSAEVKTSGPSETTTPVPPAVSPSAENNWTVPNVTRQPRFPPVMQPVSTPKTISEGDNTWISGGGDTGVNKVLKKNVSADSSEKIQGMSLSDVTEEPKSESIVERLRAQYSRLATESSGPPPRPGASSATPVRKESAGDSSQRGTPLQQRFGDRGDFQVQTAYPTTAADLSAQASSAADSHPRTSLGDIGQTVPESSVDMQKPVGGVQEPQRENGGGEDGLDGTESDVPLKERLTAAVARYRRIFKLGAKIGITASPSFSSNKGNIGEGSGDDEAKKPSDRSDFFARAKGVTGAWGIILCQELEEDSDSEDDGPQVTEEELEAFSRLLDFWDNRRASATVSHGSEVVLDDEDVSPLSENDISKIQSLLQKLEPKPADDVTEVEGTGDAHDVKDVVSEALSDDDHRLISDGNGVPSTRTIDDEVPLEGDTGNNGFPESDVLPSPPSSNGFPAISSPVAAIPTPLTGPAPPVVLGDIGHVSSPAASASDMLFQQKLNATERSTANAYDVVASSSDKPPVPGLTAAMEDTIRSPIVNKGVGSAGPPAYEAPRVVPEIEEGDMLSPRPRNTGSIEASGQPTSNVRFGGYQAGARSKTQDGSDVATDKDPIMGGSKRMSSANTLEEQDGRMTIDRRSGLMQSGTSDGSSRYGRHTRQPSSSEDHAKRGLFAFNMLGRRKSAMTTFETELMPEECLLELGKVLMALGCAVMVKKDENKMKCVAKLQNDTLKVSITCTREKKVSHVQFKRGKRDRSQVDAREFYEFFDDVRARYVRRTANADRI